MTQQPKADRYWYVMCRAHGVPTVSHITRDSAISEAKRLAHQHPGAVFEVVEVHAHVELPAPEPTVTYFGDDIPF